MNQDELNKFTLNHIYTKLKIFPADTSKLKIFLYGSRLYNIHKETSDYDIVIVDFNESETYNSFVDDDIDVHYIGIDKFKELLFKHDIMALECFYQDTSITDFSIDKETLRKSISAIVNNSYAKAKKKILLDDEDTYIGIKSFYHAYRILQFGIDIAKDNTINYHYQLPFKLPEDLISLEPTKIWECLHSYKQVLNNMASEFRLLCPIDKS